MLSLAIILSFVAFVSADGTSDLECAFEFCSMEYNGMSANNIYISNSGCSVSCGYDDGYYGQYQMPDDTACGETSVCYMGVCTDKSIIEECSANVGANFTYYIDGCTVYCECTDASYETYEFPAPDGTICSFCYVPGYTFECKDGTCTPMVPEPISTTPPVDSTSSSVVTPCCD